MAGFDNSFAHFLRTGHFISDNTPVTSQQLQVITAYMKVNPTLLDSLPRHQSVTLVKTPTNGNVSEENCPHCKKSMEEELKEAEKELQKKFKACEEKLDKFYQSVEQRLLLFGGAHAPSLATTSKAETTENKADAKTLRPT